MKFVLFIKTSKENQYIAIIKKKKTKKKINKQKYTINKIKEKYDINDSKKENK